MGLENLQDQCLAQLKLRSLKGFPGMRLTIDLDKDVLNGREVTRYFMPTGMYLLTNNQLFVYKIVLAMNFYYFSNNHLLLYRSSHVSYCQRTLYDGFF